MEMGDNDRKERWDGDYLYNMVKSDDTPYSSRLILRCLENRPLHVVAADNIADNETMAIAVYEPEQDKWSSNFKGRIP